MASVQPKSMCITQTANTALNICMKNYVHRLVTTSLRLIVALSLPGPKVAISSPTASSSVQCSTPTNDAVDYTHDTTTATVSVTTPVPPTTTALNQGSHP